MVRTGGTAAARDRRPPPDRLDHGLRAEVVQVAGRGGDSGDWKSKATVALGTIKSVVAELGVPERTAKHRMKAADDCESFTKTEQRAINNKETSIAKGKEKR